LPALLERINELAKAMLPAEGALALNRRQAAELAVAAESLAWQSDDVVLVAENLRAARAAFDRLTGRAGMEDVLDALFARFCLGK
jgi:tRNA modification GTPase